MQFSLANLETGEGDRAAICLPSGYYRLDRLTDGGLQGSLRALIDRWAVAWPTIEACADRCAEAGAASPAFVAASQARLTTPIKFPNKLLCVGAVYSDHLREFGLPAERWPKMPIFLRPPTTSLVGPEQQVPIPPNTEQFDWEVELAVVIGARITDASLQDAQAAIAGYSVGLDLTCRDLLDPTARAGVDLVRAKSQDHMAPLGPVLMPAAFVGDPQCLGLRLYVNDELKQNGNTSAMLFSVYEQVATISRFITLEPGDVVFTGSPAGSAGTTGGRYLQPGDRVRAEIEKIGQLEIGIASPRQRPSGYRDCVLES